MKKILRKEATIGLLVIIALVILFFGINFLKGINLLKASNYYYASYNQTLGLTTSAPVTLDGFKIGVVQEINYNYDNPGNITVGFSVDNALKLPKGTKANISADFLGTASLSLVLGNQADGFYLSGDTIVGNVNGGLMSSLSEELLPSVGSIMTKVDSLMTNLNTLAGNPSLSASINRFDNITAQLDASLASLNRTLAQLSPVVNNVKSITENVDTLTANLSSVSGTINNMPLDSLANDIQGTIANLRLLTDELNNPESTIGKLTKDPALYNSLNSAIGSLDSLLVDVKKNPKRYISIKLL